jgi:hypothetical protein
MAGRILLSALLSAVAIIVWGFIYWTALPFGTSSLKALPNEGAVLSTLSQNLTASGAYYFPGMDPNAPDKAAAEKTYRDKHIAGPVGILMYKKDGGEPMAPAQIVSGFIHAFISAALLGILLVMALPALPLYGQRVLFVFLGGVFAAYTVNSGYYNWWSFPVGFTLANAIYEALAWLIAGLIMARILGEGGPARGRYTDSGPRGGAFTFQPPVYVRD